MNALPSEGPDPRQGPESKVSPEAPVEQLVSFLNVQMRLADTIHGLEIDERFRGGSTTINGNPQFIDTGTANPYINTAHERIMLRSPDEVEASQTGFTRRGAKGEGSPWDSATFHVVRPLLVEGSASAGDDNPEQPSLDDDIFAVEDEETESDDTPQGMTLVRPDRFVIYIEMKDGADLCYIAHPSLRGPFILEEFDLEIFDRTMEENIDLALDELLAEIALEEGVGVEADEAVEWAEGSEPAQQTAHDDEAHELQMEAFAMQLTGFMRDRTVLHPFRAAD